ncbi:MAG: SOS response-associated peptidase [Chloroflexi bacterium]|jgi:putative SOS response-associated peptidase YedK|nr:SOS response-associated peptidase [Chloroflexota bacterium]
MCGRFALTVDPADLQDAFPEFKFPAQGAPRYNIAPSQPILGVPNDGKNLVDFFVWGLIPSWAKDPSIGNRMINARAETLAEKPAFRSAYKYHRCLIFADGFFEWQARPGSKSKVPHFIRLKSGAPFAFAGLWEHWEPADGSEVRSAAIITTEPNELMASIHNRMPVILQPDTYSQWLDSAPQSPNRLQNLLVPYPAGEMEAFPVSTLVNSPGNDRAECIVPA